MLSCCVPLFVVSDSCYVFPDLKDINSSVGTGVSERVASHELYEVP